MTKIIFTDIVRNKLSKGIDLLVQAVSTTLGPKGRNVGIDKGFEKKIIHDGVTVSKAVEPKDKFENFGVAVVREAAQKTVDEVGDGTSVSIILAGAIIQECLKIVSTGVNPMGLRKGLEQGRELLLKELDKIVKPIKTLEEKVQIATIAAEDEELGKMVGNILHDVGTDGVVTVEESKSSETIIEKQEGMQFEHGYISPYFITDPEKMEATVEDAYILLADKTISNIQELVPLLTKLQAVTTKMVVIAPDIIDTALQSFILNKVRGLASFLCVKAPSFGDKQKEFLQDIGVLTGGQVVMGDAGMRFENVEVDILGRADRITSTKDATLIVGGKGNPKMIAERVNSIKVQLEREENSFEKEKLRERLAKLSSGVAVIKVGGDTEIEMKERKERAIDAVAATKAAVEEGIVAGGEIPYLHIRKVLEGSNDPAFGVLYRALFKPFVKLMENAGIDPGEVYAEIKNTEMGIDVLDGQKKDMIQAGIVDPVLVLKSAIKNSVSVSIQIITTDCLICSEEEKK